MREDNNSDKQRVEFLTNQVWKSINILRGVLPVEHFHVYLFLLSAYYDRIIKKEFLDEGNDYQRLIYQALDLKPGYSELMDVYFPIINNIPRRNLGHLLDQFSWLDSNMPEFNFDEIFDNLLFKLADAQGKYSGEFLLPEEISSFVMEIADVPRQAKIFNPFAGLASFAIHLDNAKGYYGQEIKESTWALGMLRLMRQMKSSLFDYQNEDSIKNWPQQNNFDLVVANPPFGMKIDPRIQLFDSGIESLDYNPKVNKIFGRFSAEQFTIIKGLQSINFDGKVICVTSQGILFRESGEREFRKYLVEEGLLDTIVTLPGGLLRNTGIPICIIILTRKRNSEGLIRMIDASNFVIKENKRNKTLDVKGLLEEINSNNKNNIFRYVHTSLVRENNYNLNIRRYFINDFRGIRLVDVLKKYKGNRVGRNQHISGKFVKASNLKDDDISYQLDTDELKDKELSFTSIKIDSDCILVSLRWKSLKPTLFKYSGIPIYIGMDILALIPYNDHHEVVPNYLINELRSSNVLKQLEAYQNPGAIKSLKTSDFFELKIEIPSVEEQRAKVRGILELSEKFNLLQKERNALAHGHQVTSFDEFASLKHSLGTPRQNILSNAKSMIRFFENNDSDAFNEVKELYNKRYDTNLVDDLIQIKDDVNHISTILEKGENGLILANFDLKAISIQEIDKALKATKRNRGNYKPQYKELPSAEISGKAIKANMTLFKILIDNILSNADKYAFKSKDNANQLIIELKATEDILELEIRNNGISFPNNFNKDKFIAKFSTTSMDKGSGLGGYDINRIANYFKNPDWELDLNNDDIFPIIFRFSFPIIPMINE